MENILSYSFVNVESFIGHQRLLLASTPRFLACDPSASSVCRPLGHRLGFVDC